jgi:hypothetical protein
MAGKLEPLVLLPRFSSFAGRSFYTTPPLEVAAFAQAVVTVWRGILGPSGGGGQVEFTFLESSDGVVWTACGGTNASGDPGEEAEYVARATLTKRWLRLRVNLTSAAPQQNNLQLTCWAVGNLVRREA